VSNTKLGIQDFLTMTDEFHPEWSVFAVEASIEQSDRSAGCLLHNNRGRARQYTSSTIR
jgi:hypothetical protein